jgi:hypothetical protein
MIVIRKALCCACGQLRTFKRARNVVTDCGVDRVTWHRCTGDLKCDNCGAITRHALLREDDGHQDYAETYQRMALGGKADTSWTDVERIRREYRQGLLPRNPYVRHKWWKSAETKAIEAGLAYFPAMCGEPVKTPDKPSPSQTVAKAIVPTQVTDPDRAEHENLDVDTGLWWTQDGWCVNCLRVRNDWLLAERRKLMDEWFVWLYARLEERVPDKHVELLIAAFEATQQNLTHNKDTAR